MPLILPPGTPPPESHQARPEHDKTLWLWIAIAVGVLAVLGVAVTARGPSLPAAGAVAPPVSNPDASTALSASANTQPLVSAPAELLPSAPVSADATPSLSPDQAADIHDAQLERMRQLHRENEALPPEERRALAPTAAMIRTMEREKIILQ